MLLWRISNHRTLDGRGGLRFGARWHTKGSPIVYLAESPPGALLEMLAHLTEPDEIPDGYVLLSVRVPESVAVTALTAEDEPRWSKAEAVSRQLGDGWLKRAPSALARVPSAILPRTWNYLLNPAHPQAREAEIVETFEERLDERLIRHLGR